MLSISYSLGKGMGTHFQRRAPLSKKGFSLFYLKGFFCERNGKVRSKFAEDRSQGRSPGRRLKKAAISKVRSKEARYRKAESKVFR